MKDKVHCMGPQGDLTNIWYAFHCPGCNYGHHFEVPKWSWNGSLIKPTFEPSLLVYGGGQSPRCHSFVRDGMIQFLDDCGHDLKGQTVELPNWED